MVLSAAQREKTKKKVDSFKADVCKYTVSNKAIYMPLEKLMEFSFLRSTINFTGIYWRKKITEYGSSSHLTKKAINSKKVLDRSPSNHIIYLINFDYNLKDCLTRISNKYANF